MVAFVKANGQGSQEVLSARGGVREIRDILQDVLAQYDLREGSQREGYVPEAALRTTASITRMLATASASGVGRGLLSSTARANRSP